MLMRLVAGLVLTLGMTSLLQADAPPPPPPPGPVPDLTVLNAEGGELDGNSFTVGVSWTGEGTPRVYLIDGGNAAKSVGSLKCELIPEEIIGIKGIWATEFRGLTNQDVIIVATVGKTGSKNSVKAKIVNNPGL